MKLLCLSDLHLAHSDVANLIHYQKLTPLLQRWKDLIERENFDVDFDTLQFTGTTTDTSYVTVNEELRFWPTGNRTTTWSFGLYSSSYINYFQNFSINEAKGKIYIKTTA